MRLKNYDWNMRGSTQKSDFPIECIKVNVLMDIRDELQRIAARLGCRDALSIPHYLRTIARNTTKKKKH